MKEIAPVCPSWGRGHLRRSPKALLARPRWQARREVLLEQLWPEVDSELAVTYLNLATTRLRKVPKPGEGRPSLLESQPDQQRALNVWLLEQNEDPYNPAEGLA